MDEFWKYFVDACVFNDDTSVLYIVFVSTCMTDVVCGNGCTVSMQLDALLHSFAVVFMAEWRLFLVNCIDCLCVNIRYC